MVLIEFLWSLHISEVPSLTLESTHSQNDAPVHAAVMLTDHRSQNPSPDRTNHLSHGWTSTCSISLGVWFILTSCYGVKSDFHRLFPDSHPLLMCTTIDNACERFIINSHGVYTDIKNHRLRALTQVGKILIRGIRPFPMQESLWPVVTAYGRYHCLQSDAWGAPFLTCWYSDCY